MAKTYLYPNWVNGVPQDVEDDSVVVEPMFAKPEGCQHGDPVVSSALRVTLRGGNGDNREFPASWVLDGCTNAQIKYTQIETEYEANGGTVIDYSWEQELLGRTLAEAKSAYPGEFS